MKSLSFLIGRVALGLIAGMTIGGAIAGVLLLFSSTPRGDTPSFGIITLIMFMVYGAIGGTLVGLFIGYATLPIWDSPDDR